MCGQCNACMISPEADLLITKKTTKNLDAMTLLVKAMQNIVRLANIMTIFLPASLVVFGAVSVLLLLGGRLDNVLVWPIGLALIVIVLKSLLVVVQTDRPGSRKEQNWFDILAILVFLGWGTINAYYASQNIFVSRDPAIYSVAGAELVDDNDLNIDVTKTFGNHEELRETSAGFGLDRIDREKIYAQGTHVLPALLGLAGRVGGESLSFRINSFIGATALLAFYGFSRLFVKPRWAFLGMLTFGVSLPLIHFSRDTYTEPLAAVFTLGALALTWYAQKFKNVKRLWFLAGLTAGASVLTRVDGYLTVMAFLLFLIITLAASRQTERLEKSKTAAIFTLGMVLTSLIGWLDVTLLSSGYYSDLRKSILQQIVAVFLITIFGLLLIAVSWNTSLLTRAAKRMKNWIAPVSGILLAITLLLIVSRPLWYIGHQVADVPLIEGLQAQAGDAVDGTRSYSEQTITWISWYLGPIAALFGGVGLILAAMRTVKKPGFMLPALLVVSTASLLYLNQPSISPDQIWASRRFLPVIFPGVLFFAVVAFDAALTKLGHISKLASPTLATIAVLAIAVPLTTSYPFLRIRMYVPQYAQIKDICSRLPNKSAVLWVGGFNKSAVQTTRAYCDIPSAGYYNPTKEKLAEIASDVGKNKRTLILAVAGHQLGAVHDGAENLTLVSNINFYSMAITLNNPPKNYVESNRSVYLGVVDLAGETKKLKE